MVDADCSGKLSPQEFVQMHAVLKQAFDVFTNSDRDRSGFLNLQEIASAFTSLGYQFDMSAQGSFYTFCKS